MTRPSTADDGVREESSPDPYDSNGLLRRGGAKIRGRWLALLTALLGLLLIVFDHVVFASAQPELEALGAQPADLRRMVDAYTIALASFLLAGGALADLYGRKRALMFGILVFSLGAVACAVAETVDQIVVARAAQGAAAALTVSASLSLIASGFRGEGAGAGIGLWAALSAAALAGGPFLGAYVVEELPWDSAFFLSVPVGALALLLALAARESRDVVPFRRLDLLGSLAGTAALAYLAFALINGGPRGWRDASIVRALWVGGILLFLFFLIEARRRSPLVPLRFFRSSSFTTASFVALALLSGWYAVTAFVPLLLQNGEGLSQRDAADRLLPFAAVVVLLAPLAGWISYRRGARAPLALGCAVAAGGMQLLLRTSLDSSYEQDVLPSLLIMGVGMAFALAAVTTAALVSAGSRYSGVASGVTGTARMIGALLGLALLGAVASDIFAGRLRADLTSGGLDEATARSIVDSAPGEGALGGFRRQLPGGTPPEVVSGVELAARQSSLDAFHTAFLISAGFLLLAAIASAIFVRSHPRARPSREEERVEEAAEQRADETPAAVPGAGALAASDTTIDEAPAKEAPPQPRSRPPRGEPDETLRTTLFELPFRAGTGRLQDTIVEFLVATLPFEDYFLQGPRDTKLPSASPETPVQTTSVDIATLSGYLLLEQRFGRVGTGVRPELAATSLIGSARALRQWTAGEDDELPPAAMEQMVEMLMRGIGGDGSAARSAPLGTGA